MAKVLDGIDKLRDRNKRELAVKDQEIEELKIQLGACAAIMNAAKKIICENSNHCLKFTEESTAKRHGTVCQIIGNEINGMRKWVKING